MGPRTIGPRTATVSLGLLALGAAAFVVQSRTRAPAVERALPPSPAAAEHLRPAIVDPDLRPASRPEAALALARVFGPAVTLDAEPAVGDFNGDGSPDLAVAVRPRPGQAPALGDPLANWTVQDCDDRPAPHPVTPPVTGPRAPIAEAERLLAVIHGVGARGWRDDEARQAYLVRAGSGHLPDVRAARGPALAWARGRYACPAIAMAADARARPGTK